MKTCLKKVWIAIYSIIRKTVFKRRNRIKIGRRVQILGTSNLRVGKNVIIGSDTVITVNRRKENDEMIISDNSYIGKNNFFSVGDRIELGKFFFSSDYCMFLGAEHDKDPQKPYITNGVTTEKRINVEENVFFGAGSKVIGNVKIGFGSIIGSGAVISKDVPPLSIVIGNPQKIIWRYSFPLGKWVKPDTISDADIPKREEYIELVGKNDIVPDYYVYSSGRRYWI